MAFTKAQLDAYIQALYDDDGQLSSADYQLIINYILSNGEPETDPRDLIQVRRGDEADLPALAQGEIAFTLDSENLFVGGLAGNVNLTKSKIDIYSVKNYGAKGDGVTDDRQAIQDAINDCAANGGGIVYLPPNKTYLLNSHTRLFTYNITSVKMMLELKSNVTILGAKNAVLKVADNYTDGGDYVVFGSENVSNVSLIGFTLNQNGQNNTVVDSVANVRRAYGVRIYKGKNIIIDSLTINDCPGRNVINIGDVLTSFQTENVIVRHCEIRNVGGTITGNSNQSDHSTLYIQAKMAKVHDNYFINDNFVDVAGLSPFGLTAIEMHEGGKVFNNIVEGYRLGAYIVNQAFAGENYEYYNNKFVVTRTGIQLWTTFKVDDCHIENNIFSLYGPAQIYGIYQYTNTPTQFPIENLVISNNVIKFDNASGAAVSGGMTLTALDSAIIEGNFIEGCSGNAIYLVPADADLDILNVKIINNIFKNFGFTTGGTAFWGVYIVGDAVAEIKNIVIENNLFLNEGSITTQRGVRLNGGIIDNIIVGNLNQFINLLAKYDQITATNHTNITLPTAALYGELVFNPISLADGAGQTSNSIAVVGAAFGDYVQVSAPYDLQGCIATAYVVAAGAIKIRVQNQTGGVIDLASGTWKVKVNK